MLAFKIIQSACLQKVISTSRSIAIPCLFSDKYPLYRFDNRSSSGRNVPFSPPPKDIKRNVILVKPKLLSDAKKRTEFLEKENILTIPNVLCCARIICSPYLGMLIIGGQFNLAFYVMVAVGFTDVLDGFIARTFTSQSSKFGTFLDPLADKVLITTLCIALTWVNLIPLPLTALILSRDIALVAAGFYIRYKSLPPPKTLLRYFDATHATAKLEPTRISKFNSFVQLGAIAVGLLSPVAGFTGHPLLDYLWYFTASTTIASAVSYLYEIDKYKFSSVEGNEKNK